MQKISHYAVALSYQHKENKSLCLASIILGMQGDMPITVKQAIVLALDKQVKQWDAAYGVPTDWMLTGSCCSTCVTEIS